MISKKDVSIITRHLPISFVDSLTLIPFDLLDTQLKPKVMIISFLLPVFYYCMSFMKRNLKSTHWHPLNSTPFIKQSNRAYSSLNFERTSLNYPVTPLSVLMLWFTDNGQIIRVMSLLSWFTTHRISSRAVNRKSTESFIHMEHTNIAH